MSRYTPSLPQMKKFENQIFSSYIFTKNNTFVTYNPLIYEVIHFVKNNIWLYNPLIYEVIQFIKNIEFIRNVP